MIKEQRLADLLGKELTRRDCLCLLFSESSGLQPPVLTTHHVFLIYNSQQYPLLMVTQTVH